MLLKISKHLNRVTKNIYKKNKGSSVEFAFLFSSLFTIYALNDQEYILEEFN